MFITFFKIGAFTIGGGYAMLPFIQEEVVEKNKWLTMEEFLDIIAVAEVTPGPVAVNTSTYVGYKLRGVKGALICTLGTILPSFLIILAIVTFLWKYRQSEVADRVFLGIRPAVAALIFSAVYKIGKTMKITKPTLAITIVTIILIVVLNISPIYIILSAAFGSIGYFKYKENRQ